ncbi:MAG: RDD family protein [Chloroflexaceae bacterium]|jgi:uncharacterized RDD family membrane protein YckC|nr:RDD family protein [Chloroflexaceae bacterium]
MIDRYTVDTPENIEFGYDVAGIGSRFLAALIDSLFIILLQVALVFALLFAFGAGSIFEPEFGDGPLVSVAFAIYTLLSFLFFFGYYLLFEVVWNGQSPGKRALGLRVVREGGRPITFIASAIRNLIRLIDLLPGLYGIGVIVMFIDPRSRRLGDLAAGTFVVKERRPVTLESLTQRADASGAGVLMPGQPGVSVRPVPPSLPYSIPNLHLITDGDYDLAQEFLRRRGELHAASRAQVGGQLAANLSARLGLTLNSPPEPFLETLVNEYRRMRQEQQVRG